MITNKKKFSIMICMTIASLFIICSSASASFIDFRNYSEGFGPAVGSVTFTATTTGGDLYWDNIDGYGVMGGENDEVDGTEMLIISFSGPMARLNQIFITDLFNENHTTEAGTFSINGGSPIGIFYAVEELDGINNGQLTLDLTPLNLTNVSSIEFMVPTDMFGKIPAGYEFSVMGIDAMVNPEPSTFILFGSGLLGMVVCARKLRKK